jgi:isopentenyldiphosphate isomerase
MSCCKLFVGLYFFFQIMCDSEVFILLMYAVCTTTISVILLIILIYIIPYPKRWSRFISCLCFLTKRKRKPEKREPAKYAELLATLSRIMANTYENSTSETNIENVQQKFYTELTREVNRSDSHLYEEIEYAVRSVHHYEEIPVDNIYASFVNKSNKLNRPPTSEITQKV